MKKSGPGEPAGKITEEDNDGSYANNRKSHTLQTYQEDVSK